MRRPEVEYWAIQVIERVLRHEPVEDDLVELKTDWPKDPVGAARRVAAHANSARMEPILWLIGVDEKAAKVTGASSVDPATWFAQINAEFVDKWYPSASIYALPHSGTTVVAILFRTDGVPYLVRSPQERFEVPWRGTTHTRSARRSELISILYPASRQPAIEVLSGIVLYRIIVSTKSRAPAPFTHVWQVQLELYVTPRGSGTLVFPFHKFQAYAVSSDRKIGVDFTTFAAGADDTKGTSLTYATKHELIVDGPGRLSLLMESTVDDALDLSVATMPLTLHVVAKAATADTVVNLTIPFHSVKIVPNTSATWQTTAV